jgi:hypothetical protein
MAKQLRAIAFIFKFASWIQIAVDENVYDPIGTRKFRRGRVTTPLYQQSRQI